MKTKKAVEVLKVARECVTLFAKADLLVTKYKRLKKQLSAAEIESIRKDSQKLIAKYAYLCNV